jgi:hypothetical protein
VSDIRPPLLMFDLGVVVGEDPCATLMSTFSYRKAFNRD